MNKEENNQLSQTAEDEKKILEFWEKEDIFQKSIDQRKDEKEFIFYDGPPFATGLPHFGHLLPGTIKDVIPRYKTMKGFRVERNWGWDCHGLPIENMIEKEMDFNSKGDIENFGIDNFNNKCEKSVLRYDEEWKNIIPKTGRWANMEKPYKTMDSSYTESIWWAFSELNKKGLVKKNFKPMHICPRCETTLSNNEVADGYKDIKDLTLIAKFELENKEDTFVLAWTTTPWTLPGNVALAVGEDIDYVKTASEENSEKYIFAKELFEKIQKNAGFDLKIIEEFKGSELIGKSYKPLFDYYSEKEDLENKENGWKIYSADFVTIEAGTGVVHIAPAFGSDDLELGKKNSLPWIQHIGMDGKFKKEVKDFIGMAVRKINKPEEADIEIIKNLAHNGKLFFKEKYEHSYPHCWRCKTPLLNYATSSWFIDSPQLKEKLLEENSKINWIPKHIGEKRFHNWLDSTRPWAVSRSRYWGAPLPVWENKESGEYKIIGSLEELKNKTRSKNNLIIIRHGESESNITDTVSTTRNLNGDSLSDKGKGEAKEAKKKIIEILKSEVENKNEEKIDYIISSPFSRTTETAKIIAEDFGISEDKIIFDERIREEEHFQYDGKTWKEYLKDKKELSQKDCDYFDLKVNGGESKKEVRKRIMEFLYDIDKKYSGKNILIVTHFGSLSMAVLSTNGEKGSNILEKRKKWGKVFNSKPFLLDFAPIPHDENYELDFHRPYIDEISFEEDGKKYECIKEVFDCWFESGSMPFASKHFPFENLDTFNPKKNIGFPADFIAEGQDQTRGWFNTMLILSTALFGKSSFKNVVVNGTVLAEDGKKMSKSLKNYPDINLVLNKYGGDSVRFLLMSSPAVRSESIPFSEKAVDEIMKKIVLKIKNILAFYELYKNDISERRDVRKTENILDQWIEKKMDDLILEVSSGLENYQIDEATKNIILFVDDFSTWYVRRSRDRYKGENIEDRDFALLTTRDILKKFSKIISPVMPFLADNIWDKLRDENEKISVHLEDWPEIEKNKNEEILEKMKNVREIVSLGMEARVVAGLKVRQPLESITIFSDLKMEKDFQEIILEELNIKNISFEKKDGEKFSVVLEKNISPELKKEGEYREFLRQVQIMRKNSGLKVEDIIELTIDLNSNENNFIEDFLEDLKRTAGVEKIVYSEISDENFIKINEKEIRISLKQI